jgi:hypothetical protein
MPDLSARTKENNENLPTFIDCRNPLETRAATKEKTLNIYTISPPPRNASKIIFHFHEDSDATQLSHDRAEFNFTLI